jgi:outer membrane protein OmpA-like peptidoglycan-associated protein
MHRRRHLLLVASLLSGLAACTTGPMSAGGSTAQPTVVFFTADSAALDEPARAIIRKVAEAARANPSAPVQVRGFAAPDTGSPAFNSILSRARAQNVADGLVAAGVPQRRVRIESRGAVPFEMMPTEARRVEIVIGT